MRTSNQRPEVDASSIGFFLKQLQTGTFVLKCAKCKLLKPWPTRTLLTIVQRANSSISYATRLDFFSFLWVASATDGNLFPAWYNACAYHEGFFSCVVPLMLDVIPPDGIPSYLYATNASDACEMDICPRLFLFNKNSQTCA